MKCTGLIFLLLLFSMTTVAGMVEDFSDGWKFWSATSPSRVIVKLPHDAMQTETRSASNTNGYSMGYYPGNKYYYEKQIDVTADMLNKHITMEFEGVYCRSKVYINNKVAGGTAYGYSAFSVCADGLLHQGQNTIRIEVDNSLVPNSRWYTGAGIYRPVHLKIQELSYIDDVRITTISTSPARVSVSTKHVGGSVEVAMFDGIAKVASASGDSVVLTVPEAKLWSAEHPSLYQVVVTLKENGKVQDTITKDFGIRQISWSPKGFFSIRLT